MNVQRVKLIKNMLDHYRVRAHVVESLFADEVMAAYNFDTHSIEISQNNIDSPREFILSVLHEINHAMMARRMGRRIFKKKYMIESNFLSYHSKDPYWDNKYEIQAETFARQNYKRWVKFRPV